MNQIEADIELDDLKEDDDYHFYMLAELSYLAARCTKNHFLIPELDCYIDYSISCDPEEWIIEDEIVQESVCRQ